MRASTEMLLGAAAGAALFGFSNALLGRSTWGESIALGLAVGVGAFLFRFVDGDTRAQEASAKTAEVRLALIEARVAELERQP